MAKVNFLIAIHSHQPVGNFGGVFADAFEKAYLPFIDVLEAHPKIKLSLHYSGSLLDWLAEKHPEFLERLKSLVKIGQIEIIAGGYYEPVLPMIPLQDALAQVKLLKEKIKDIFSYEATGAWTTERIWEPKMPAILATTGIKYTLVDDSHFKQVGFNTETLTGFYKSEDEGKCIAIFPASEKLRYLMPFKLPQETIDYLGCRLKDRNEVTVSFADDGEKFGLWPGTNKWVYKEKWLDNFFSALDNNSNWINLQTFSEYLEANLASGLAYLECSSYREMLEWSGGYYRNFLIKYPEANNMHKKMFYVSKRLEETLAHPSVRLRLSKLKTKDQKIELAKRHLYMGQANDAYWHGVFGGLYLNHLRTSVYKNLIEADKIIDQLTKEKDSAKELDLDCDGGKEAILNSEDLKLYFKKKGAVLYELDYKPKSINLANTISRKPESYHQRIRDKLTHVVKDSNEPLSIHDLKEVKEEGLENFLFYDYQPRYCLWDHFLKTNTSLEDFVHSEYLQEGDFLHHIYETKIDSKAVRLNFSSLGNVQDKKIRLNKEIWVKNRDLNLEYKIDNASNNELETIFGVEFNLSIYDVTLSRGAGILEELRSLEINDLWNQLKIDFQFERETAVWHFPVETISDSETGIERSYQELCLLFHWRIKLSANESFKSGIKISISE